MRDWGREKSTWGDDRRTLTIVCIFLSELKVATKRCVCEYIFLCYIYYSPQGYWKGLAAVKKLSTVVKVSEEVAKKWLVKQALWQIYLPAPRYIPWPKFDVSLPNAVHQADLLFLPHDKLRHGRKVYKYALTVVDVASRYKVAEPLTSKESDEVSKAF